MKLLVVLALAGLAYAMPQPEAAPEAEPQPEADPEADPALLYTTGLTYPYNYGYHGLPLTTYSGLPLTTYSGLRYPTYPLTSTVLLGRKKREADPEPEPQPEADPEADPALLYTTGLTYPYTYGYHGLPLTTYSGLPLTTYSGLRYPTYPLTSTVLLGRKKREAEAEPQPEADPEADPALFYSTGLTYPITYTVPKVSTKTIATYTVPHAPLTYSTLPLYGSHILYGKK